MIVGNNCSRCGVNLDPDIINDFVVSSLLIPCEGKHYGIHYTKPLALPQPAMRNCFISWLECSVGDVRMAGSTQL